MLTRTARATHARHSALMRCTLQRRALVAPWQSSPHAIVRAPCRQDARGSQGDAQERARQAAAPAADQPPAHQQVPGRRVVQPQEPVAGGRVQRCGGVLAEAVLRQGADVCQEAALRQEPQSCRQGAACMFPTLLPWLVLALRARGWCLLCALTGLGLQKTRDMTPRTLPPLCPYTSCPLACPAHPGAHSIPRQGHPPGLLPHRGGGGACV